MESYQHARAVPPKPPRHGRQGDTSVAFPHSRAARVCEGIGGGRRLSSKAWRQPECGCVRDYSNVVRRATRLASKAKVSLQKLVAMCYVQIYAHSTNL